MSRFIWTARLHRNRADQPPDARFEEADGPALGKRDLVRHVLEHDLQRHPDANRRRVRLDAHQVRRHARALLKLDDGGDVRGREAWGWRAMDDAEGMERGAARRLEPACVAREAKRTDRARVEVGVAARLATHDPQLVLARPLPVILRLGLRNRERPGRTFRAFTHRPCDPMVLLLSPTVLSPPPAPRFRWTTGSRPCHSRARSDSRRPGAGRTHPGAGAPP